MSADMVLYNGVIVQMNATMSIQEAVAIKNGKIMAICSNQEIKKYISTDTKVIDLDGKTVVPGFIDSHVHLMPTCINELAINFEEARSVRDVLDLIKERVERSLPKEVIWGVRLDEFKLDKRILPTKNDIDKVAPNQPVFISSIEYHTVTVNSYALNKINLPFTVNGIEKDSNGFFTGRLHHHASIMARKKMYEMISDEDQSQGLQITMKKVIQKGVTSLVSMEGGSLFHDRHAEFLLREKSKLPVDIIVFYQTTDINKVLAYNLPRFGGDIFLDGSFRSSNAALYEPYSDDNGNLGTMYFTQEEMDSFILEAHEKNLQIAIHAVGGRAIDRLLDAYEKALIKSPRNDHRHRIEHFELPTIAQIKRAKRLGIILSMHPTYEYFFREPNGMYEVRLGKERSLQTNPFRKILDCGIIIAGGSDSDVMPIDPLLGIHAAVNHPNIASRITPYEALKMYTVNAAIGVFEENIKGSIEENKLADMVVLNTNPLLVKTDYIKDIKVIYTIKNGRILYDAYLGGIL
ncbi:MAG: putative amidohydrolase YtcJ [Clostridium sp.]|jgi:predicted amidohydrolase YtcJ